jgi:hypothetical protein
VFEERLHHVAIGFLAEFEKLVSQFIEGGYSEPKPTPTQFLLGKSVASPERPILDQSRMRSMGRVFYDFGAGSVFFGAAGFGCSAGFVVVAGTGSEADAYSFHSF